MSAWVRAVSVCGLSEVCGAGGVDGDGDESQTDGVVVAGGKVSWGSLRPSQGVSMPRRRKGTERRGKEGF